MLRQLRNKMVKTTKIGFEVKSEGFLDFIVNAVTHFVLLTQLIQVKELLLQLCLLVIIIRKN